MENSLIRTKANMKNKVPEIERTLELVKALKEKQVSVEPKGALIILGITQAPAASRSFMSVA
jgi:hypothetical protein